MIYIVFINILLASFFTGCFSKTTIYTPSISNDFYLNNIYLNNEERNSDEIYSKKQTNFFALTNYLAEPICKKIEQDDVIYMVDFVNESNLQNRSQLGFLLSNSLKVNILNEKCTKKLEIKSFEFGTNLKLGGDGSRIMSRKLSELRTKNIDICKQILVGTYIFTKKQVIFYLKLIDIDSGNIISSNYFTTPLTLELEDLEGINKKEESAPIINKPFHL